MTELKPLAELNTLEELFERMKLRGYLLNNLWQESENMWVANVRRESQPASEFTEFGRGTTPVRALKHTLHNASAATNLSDMYARKKFIRSA